MKYRVVQGMEDCVIYTIPPTYKREEGGKFNLSTISQKDMGYLKKVIGSPEIEEIDEKEK